MTVQPEQARQIDKAINKLIKELGRDSVKNDDFFRAAYSSEGMAAFRPGIPNAVVLPSSIEEVQILVRIANEFNAPLVPVGGRISGFRMIDIPPGGGIVVDLAKMNRIPEIDEDNLSVTAEAGCSVYQVDKELRKRGYRLPCHPAAQPGMIGMGSEVAKCTVGAYGTGVGPVDRWVLGLKVVLGNGDVLETGSSRMVGAPHYQRYKIPDLTSLFMGSEGGLGIITEVTQRLCPEPVSMKSIGFEFPDTDEGMQALMKAGHELRKRGLFFDMYLATPSNVAYFLRSAHYLATMSPDKIDDLATASPHGDFPPDKFGNVLLVIVESLVSEDEAESKEKAVISICKKYGGKYLGGEMSGLDFHSPGNLWGPKTGYIRGELGQRQNWHYFWSELPWFDLPEAIRRMELTIKRVDLPPGRFYWGAYFSSYGSIIAAFVHYWAHDVKEREEAIKWREIVNKEIAEGFMQVPTGIGKEIRSIVLGRLKPNSAIYLQKVKQMFDPNNIMNPGTGIF